MTIATFVVDWHYPLGARAASLRTFENERIYHIRAPLDWVAASALSPAPGAKGAKTE